MPLPWIFSRAPPSPQPPHPGRATSRQKAPPTCLSTKNTDVCSLRPSEGGRQPTQKSRERQHKPCTVGNETFHLRRIIYRRRNNSKIYPRVLPPTTMGWPPPAGPINRKYPNQTNPIISTPLASSPPTPLTLLLLLCEFTSA